ncbi:MAG TPA: DnaA regulatory inactivator Hda [Methylophilaceae bacterium]
MKQLLLDIQPSLPPTLENFVGGSNDELLQVLGNLNKLDKSQRSLTLWGEAGSGKTHLLIAAAAKVKNIGLTAVYLDAPQAHQLVEQQADLLALDNVQRLDGTAQIALFNLFNQYREQGKLLLVASPVAPAQLAVRDDLKTRLAWGLVYQVSGLTDAEKIQALQSHALERGMQLPQEVIAYCLRHLRRDLPTLMATLDALDDWSLTAKKPVTITMIRELVQTPSEF